METRNPPPGLIRSQREGDVFLLDYRIFAQAVTLGVDDLETHAQQLHQPFGDGAPIFTAFSRMEPSSVRMYQTNTKGAVPATITVISIPVCSVTV